DGARSGTGCILFPVLVRRLGPLGPSPEKGDFTVIKIDSIRTLRAGAAPFSLALALVATPGFAQDAAPQGGAEAPEADDEEIVVTGTILRGSTTDSVSPITVVTAESLEQRGINTTQEAIQRLSSNNGPALTNSFS